MKYSFLGSLSRPVETVEAVNCGGGHKVPTCSDCERSESGCRGDCEFKDGWLSDSCVIKEQGKRDLIM